MTWQGIKPRSRGDAFLVPGRENGFFYNQAGYRIGFLCHEGGRKKTEPLVVLSGIIYNVSMSPEGNYITYAAEKEKKHGIYVQDIKKKVEKKLIGD